MKKLTVLSHSQSLDQRKKTRWIFYALAFLCGGLLLIFLAKTLKSLFLPVIFGALLAYVFRPVKTFLRVSWMPDQLRILLIFSAVLLAVFWASAGVKSLIPGELGSLELKIRMQYKFNEKLADLFGVNVVTGEGNEIYELLRSEIQPAIHHVNDLLALSPKEVKAFLKYVNHPDVQQRPPLPYIIYFKSNQRFVRGREDFSVLPVSDLDVPSTKAIEERAPAQHGEVLSEQAYQQRQGAAVGGLLGVLSTWFVMPLVFIFLLFDDGQILRFFLKLIPNRYFEVSMMVIKEFDEAVGRYLRGTLLECSLVGLSLALGLFIIGVNLPVALVIGFIAGMTNAIPFLGPFIGLVVGLAYALIAEDINPLLPFLDGDDLFVGVMVCVAVTQLLDNVLFQPVVLGNAVNLHPLVVILGVVGGSISFGFMGMLLAIPTIVVAKTVVETLFKELKAYRII